MPPRLQRLLRDVGRRASELRVGRGLTQQALADKLQVGVKYVQRVEAGGYNLTLESLLKLATALGAEPAALLAEPRTTSPRRRGRPPKQATPRARRRA